MVVLREWWEETSYHIERLQVNSQCAEEERKNIFDRKGPSYSLPFKPKPTPSPLLEMKNKPEVAILREEGSNGDREMTSAFYQAGFTPWDISSERTKASFKRTGRDWIYSIFCPRTRICTSGWLDALIGHDGKRRVFAQLTADPDRPEVRPEAAYLQMLNSMQPSWILRILQIFWPDPLPRQKFYDLVETWPEPKTEGLSILLDGLKLAVQQQGIPYTRKTIIEFVHMGPECSPWWESIHEICSVYGVQVKYMSQEEVEALAHWILNPSLT